jgi:anthranilate synthase component 1
MPIRPPDLSPATAVADGFRYYPLVLTLPADFFTPLAVFWQLQSQGAHFLLESVQGGERWGRFSVIGLRAEKRFVWDKGYWQQQAADGTVDAQEAAPTPWLLLKNILKNHRAVTHADLPRFQGGLVGYFAYELIASIESRLGHNPLPKALDLPPLMLWAVNEFAIVDNLRQELRLVVLADLTAEGFGIAAAESRLADLAKTFQKDCLPPLPVDNCPETLTISDAFPKANFLQAVEKIIDYIKAGDIMQAVLAQRQSAPYARHPLHFYRALRRLNPSPYMFYCAWPELTLIGASPEILVRQEGLCVTVRPIAGTRPRGKTPEQDLALAAELKADPKELAEHLMLIDLGRNDIGRVCRLGSIRLREQMLIERYSHVMHLVSEVEGERLAHLDAVDVLQATFPAGTLSGAPKIRAMEILQALEPQQRGIYGGAVGFLSWTGDMDLAIAIRTAVLKDGVLSVQAGAGIVADSIAENEWQETVNKAKALWQAAIAPLDN